MHTAPIRVPTTLPRPPVNAVPPTTTAAITSSSYPTPAFGTAAPSRAVSTTAANPTSNPFATYVPSATARVSIPASHAAGSLPPSAYTQRPHTVRERTNQPPPKHAAVSHTGTGTPRRIPCPSQLKPAGRSLTACPDESRNAHPRSIDSRARVTRNAGARTRETTSPVTAPPIAPVASAAAIAAAALIVALPPPPTACAAN